MPEEHKVSVTVRGLVDGLDCEVTLTTEAPRLRAAVHYLRGQGLEPLPRPAVYSLTPDGAPICPRHNVPMRLREKQGDAWHSHAVETAGGEVLWCRGYAGPDSPGYLVEPAAAAAIRQRDAAGGVREGALNKTARSAPEATNSAPGKDSAIARVAGR